jgi:autotransporter-associated beta strand protein
MFSPVRRLVSRICRTHRTLRSVRRGPSDRVRPVLEALEARLAPATVTWDGSADGSNVPFQNANWTSPQNWVGDVAPSPGDDLVFPAGALQASSVNDFAPGTAFHSITLDYNNYQLGNGYQLSGNPVCLQAGITATNTKGVNTVGLPITLTAAQTFKSTNAGTNLVLTAPLDNGGCLLTVTGAGDLQFSGPSITGAGGLTKNGTGQLVLADITPDTYTGATTVNAGTLLLWGSQGNAVSGDLVVGNGSGGANADIVRLAGANQISNTSAVSITPSGLLDLNGFNDTIGPLTMTGGNITTGTGRLTLNGDVTTLPSSMQATICGHLSLGSGTTARTFTLGYGTADIDLDIQATIAGGSGVALVKQGSGFLMLEGNNTYAGQTQVAAGTLLIDSANALGATTAGTTVNDGASLYVLNPTPNSWLTFAAEPLTLTGSGDPDLVGGGALQGDGTSASLSLPGTITLAGPAVVMENSATILNLTGKVTGTGGLTKTGSGEVKLFRANDYTGTTVINQGILTLENPSALGAFGPGNGTTVTGTGTLQLDSSLTFDPEDLTLQGTGSGGSSGGLSALHSVGSNTWTGTINLAASSQVNVTSGGTLTLSGPISGPATSSLTIGRAIAKYDDGIVLLPTANTYAGSTIVDVGTLAIANPTALGSPSGVANKGTTVHAGATLQLRGGLAFDPTEALALNGSGYKGTGALNNGTGNNTWAGTVYLASSASIGATGGTTLTLAGVVSGPAGSTLTKVGSGTVALAAADTYAGATVVAAGTLALQNAAALGASTAGATVNSGATLQLQGGITYNAEPLTLNGRGVGATAGALESQSGANTWTGPITLASAATVRSDTGSSLSVSGAVANEGYLLSIDAQGDADFSYTISGAGGLTKGGPGTLSFSGTAPNVYAGTTTVNAGTLLLAKPSAIVAVAGAGLTINAGATLAGSGTISTNVTNAGVVNPGGSASVGTLTINGNYTQAAGGVLNLELASSSLFDQLVIAGLAALSGTLNVSLLGGFLPAVGDLYAVLTFGSSSGAFAAINLPNPGNGVVLSAVYDPTDLTLTAHT